MTTSNYDYLMSVYNDIKQTFTLYELDEDFYNKVIFVYLNHSSGLGGPGCLIMITSDNKEYFIGFDAINRKDNKYDDSGIDEYNLSEYIPLLKGKVIKEKHYRIKYDIEDNGWINKNRVLIRKDYYEKIKDIYEEKEKYKYFHPLDIGNILVDKNNKPQRIYYLAYKKYIEDEIEEEKKHINDLLTLDDIEWKEYYRGNYKYSDDAYEDGYYCLLFKYKNDKWGEYFTGHRWIIKYQFKDASVEYKLDRKTGKALRISQPEFYNLFYKYYENVDGILHYPDPSKEKKDNEGYITFDGSDMNDEGRFIASYKSLDEAKEGMLKWNNCIGYGSVLKSNRCFDYPSEEYRLRNKKGD